MTSWRGALGLGCLALLALSLSPALRPRDLLARLEAKAVPQAIRGVSGERRAPFAGLARPTFHASVEPILQARCQTCHRPGGIAPFPF